VPKTYLDLYCTQVLRHCEGWIGTRRRSAASGSRSVVFLLLETLRGACAGYVVSLELAEKLQDLIIGQKGGAGVQYLCEIRRKREDEWGRRTLTSIS
jgi:hypothetical protein